MKSLADWKLLMAVICVSWLTMASAAHANQYKILVTGASLATEKRVGDKRQPWDFPNGKPDAYVVVEFDGQPVYVSGVSANVVRARWFTGTEYWKLPMTTTVTITLRDADAGKMVTGIGMVGVAVQPDIPRIGKRLINNALATIDTDDTIAVWSGTLGQLMRACGGVEADLMRSPTGKPRFRSNAGLTSLNVRVIERPHDFDITSPAKKRYFGVSGATVEPVKRGTKLPWDVGLNAATRPDPRYLVYVNGSAVLAGAVNRDSVVATWAGDPVALDLRDDDTIAVALFDADAGAQLSTLGKVAVLYSPSLPAASKERVFETLNKMATDDLIFLWVGNWKTLAGSRTLPRARNDPYVWSNDGVTRVDVATRPAKPAVRGAAVQLILVSAAIQKTKSNGKAWDMGAGKPDPLIRCSVPAAGGGWRSIGETAVVKNSLLPAWGVTLTDAQLKVGTQLRFEVLDKDGVSDDVIATIIVILSDRPGYYAARGGSVKILDYKIVAPGR